MKGNLNELARAYENGENRRFAAWRHTMVIHEARQLPADGLLFRFSVMCIPLIRLTTCVEHAALIDRVAEGAPSIATKTQQCSLAAECSTSSTAHGCVGGGVSYAEVIT